MTASTVPLGRTGLRGPSLVERATAEVKGHIAREALRVGDTLPGEGYFAEKVGVSRAVMREAFGVLGALRVLDVGNGRRPRVGALDGSVLAETLEHGVATAQISIANVWDVRRAIEGTTARLAALQRSGAQAAEIVALADAMAADANDAGRRAEHDIAMHLAIAQASGNPLFGKIVGSFGPLMDVAVPAAWRTRTDEGQRDAMIERHLAIARAIAAQDGAAAADAMEAHFETSIRDMLLPYRGERDAD
jgi:DNA-binding FadR family transcriptional regulator